MARHLAGLKPARRRRRARAGLALLPPLLLASAGAALAALPPNAQRAREIAAVVEAAAPRLEAPIDAVRLVEPYRYEVGAGSCRVEVRIIVLPPKVNEGAKPGPLPFRAVAGEAACAR
jgi:hypothetical protein